MLGKNSKLDTNADALSWRSLLAFSSYRLFLALTLFIVFYFDLPPTFLGESKAELYLAASQVYIATAFVLLLFVFNRWGSFTKQVKIQLTIDIILLALIIHASGGLQSGLGSLLVVVVISGGALIPGRFAAFFAALATFAVLSEAVFSQVLGDGSSKYSYAGLLGATFFATAILTELLSKKIVSTQKLAQERAEDLANLAVLNNHIISRMQTGVLVVDGEGKIQLSNESAQKLLGIETAKKEDTLKYWVPILGIQLWRWKQSRANTFDPFQARADLPEVVASAMNLASGETVLYIENTSAVAQQAQQLKLASLGQLTASIAHEVRNPLAAISHAGELLSEAKAEDEELTKLTGIIQRHSSRVNNIIETILEMSRMKAIEPSVLVLETWLEQFIGEFCGYHQLDRREVNLVSKAPLATVYIDANQLHQVMLNLFENAWYYSHSEDDEERIIVTLEQQGHDVIIDVADNGPGVSEKVRNSLFEPFQSQRQGGTGLGLYLARELCQANGARLSYLPDEQGRTCFRINISADRFENLA